MCQIHDLKERKVTFRMEKLNTAVFVKYESNSREYWHALVVADIYLGRN